MPRKILAVLVIFFLVSCGPPPITHTTTTGHLDFSNQPNCEYFQGVDHLRRLEFESAMACLGPIAARGDEDAQYHIGMMLLRGQGIEKNPREAIYWLGLAAEGGDASAQFELGQIYREGAYVKRDNTKALLLYQKSAEQNHSVAQYDLFEILYFGQGTTKDVAAAMDWLHRSAEDGFSVAQHRLGKFYRDGENVSKDRAKASRLFQNAANQNYEPACRLCRPSDGCELTGRLVRIKKGRPAASLFV